MTPEPLTPPRVYRALQRAVIVLSAFGFAFAALAIAFRPLAVWGVGGVGFGLAVGGFVVSLVMRSFAREDARLAEQAAEAARRAWEGVRR